MAEGPERPRKISRRSSPVDVESFLDEIDAALDAFSSDVSYACLMARSAVTIERKRQLWQVRRELKGVAAPAK